jgi:hypothetical protein
MLKYIALFLAAVDAGVDSVKSGDDIHLISVEKTCSKQTSPNHKLRPPATGGTKSNLQTYERVPALHFAAFGPDPATPCRNGKHALIRSDQNLPPGRRKTHTTREELGRGETNVPAPV